MFKDIGLFLVYAWLALFVLITVHRFVFKKTKEPTLFDHLFLIITLILCTVAAFFIPDPPMGRPGYILIVIVLYSALAHALDPKFHLHILIGRVFGWSPPPPQQEEPAPAAQVPPPAPDPNAPPPKTTEQKIEELIKQSKR